MSSFAVHWGHVGMFGVKACSLPRRRTVTQGHAGYITEHLWVRSVARDFVILYVDVSLRQALIESFLGMSKVHIYLAVPFLLNPVNYLYAHVLEAFVSVSTKRKLSSTVAESVESPRRSPRLKQDTPPATPRTTEGTSKKPRNLEGDFGNV